MEEENRTKRKAARAAVSFAAVGVLLVVIPRLSFYRSRLPADKL